MTNQRVPMPTALSRRTVAYIVGFGVAVPIGLAPYLGKLDVPGFAPLLTLLPNDSWNVLIPASTFLMGLAATAIQFYFGDSIAPRRLNRLFGADMLVLLVGLGALVILSSHYVVPVQDGQELVIVGWSRSMCKVCADGRTPLECLEGFSFQAERCWGADSVRQVRDTLICLYLLLTGGFGALIGLLLLKGEARRQQREKQESEAGLSLLQRKSAATENRTVSLEAPLRDAPRPALGAQPLAAPEWTCDLFLSYATEDKDFVAGLVEELESRGLAIWWDLPKVGAGDSIGASIEEGLRKSRRFAVVLSPNSVSSDWVLDELEAARALAPERKKQGVTSYLIPILYQDCVVPELLRGKRYADFTHSRQKGLDELLHQLLPSPGPPQSKPS